VTTSKTVIGRCRSGSALPAPQFAGEVLALTVSEIANGLA
jgi:hypothetical protein